MKWLGVLAIPLLYLVGYESTRYLVWWRYHDRFAWWKTLREEWRNIP